MYNSDVYKRSPEGTMVRTQIYLTEAEKEALSRLSAARGVSQSDLIRDAVDAYLREQDTDLAAVLGAAAGLWADRDDVPELGELRRGWARRRHHG